MSSGSSNGQYDRRDESLKVGKIRVFEAGKLRVITTITRVAFPVPDDQSSEAMGRAKRRRFAGNNGPDMVGTKQVYEPCEVLIREISSGSEKTGLSQIVGRLLHM